MGDVISSVPILDGVVIVPLRQIADERGAVMHMLRVDSPLFEQFGEAYFSLVRPGAVKAWKRHMRMSQNLAVPVGEIDLVIFDDRPESRTRGVVQEITVGSNCYGLIHIPPRVWYGFKARGTRDALIANCASLPHDPDEVERVPPDHPAIPYYW